MQSHNQAGQEEDDLGQSTSLVPLGPPQPGLSAHAPARLAHAQRVTDSVLAIGFCVPACKASMCLRPLGGGEGLPDLRYTWTQVSPGKSRGMTTLNLANRVESLNVKPELAPH